jgi:hypothetical protein
MGRDPTKIRSSGGSALSIRGGTIARRLICLATLVEAICTRDRRREEGAKAAGANCIPASCVKRDFTCGQWETAPSIFPVFIPLRSTSRGKEKKNEKKKNEREESVERPLKLLIDFVRRHELRLRLYDVSGVNDANDEP